MKITRWIIRDFEKSQKLYGTKVALENVIWLLAADILIGIGVKGIKTTYKLKGRGFQPGSRKKLG